jgi:para-nitrobenzyl esterase
VELGKAAGKDRKIKSFYYYFDQHPIIPGFSEIWLWLTTWQEVAYVFEHLNTSNPQITKTDLEISDAMGTYWTNFSKYGNPNGKGMPEWPLQRR